VIESEPYTGIAVQRDIKYGDDARHPLDIFMPKAPSASPRPSFLVQSEGLNDASCRPGRCRHVGLREGALILPRRLARYAARASSNSVSISICALFC
jgi:hypothetical protein